MRSSQRNFKEGGFDVNPGMTTQSVRNEFEKLGFRYYPMTGVDQVKHTDQLVPGDILLRKTQKKNIHGTSTGHVETFIGKFFVN